MSQWCPIVCAMELMLGARLKARQSFEEEIRGRGVSEVAGRFAKDFAGPQNAGFGNGWAVGPSLGQRVTPKGSPLIYPTA